MRTAQRLPLPHKAPSRLVPAVRRSQWCHSVHGRLRTAITA